MSKFRQSKSVSMEGHRSLSSSVRKGAWTGEEDDLLKKCIEKYGEGKWHQVPSRAGLNRCRKSCRLRWLNYLKPDIKRGYFADDEIDLIIRLHNLLGNRWSLIAGRLPGRTANDVKNYWNTHLLKNKINRVPFVKHLNPKSSYINRSKFNTKLVKPRPQTLLRNTIFPINPTIININNNNNTSVTRGSNDSILADRSDDNNDEMMWLENLLMNDEDQQGDSVNKIGSHYNLEDIFLDVEPWNVFGR